MQVMEINVPDNKARLVTELLTELGVTINATTRTAVLNAETIAAMEELTARKGKKFKSVDDLFASI